MRWFAVLAVLLLIGAALMAEPTTYTFTVTSGTVDLSITMNDDPNELTTSDTLSGTFTLIVDHGDAGIEEGDLFELETATLTNDGEMSLSIVGLVTATVQPGSARFLDFDWGNDDQGTVDANGVGLINTESYVEATLIVTGVIETTFSSSLWSESMPWTVVFNPPPVQRLTLNVNNPAWGSVEAEGEAASLTATLAGTNHLEAYIEELSGTLKANIAADIEGEAPWSPNAPYYPKGGEVTLQAQATAGYVFVGWEGDVPPGHANDNPLTLTMDADKTLTASFTPAVTVTVHVDPNLIVSGGSSTLAAAPTGGTSPYTYQWNTGQTTSSITVSPTQTTEYTVTVTDNLGEVGSGSATVTVASAVSVAVQASPTVVAAGHSSILTATPSGGKGPYTYLWSTGQTTAAISVAPTQTTEYTVTATDTLGQEDDASATVTVASGVSLTAAADPDLIAAGSNSVLTCAASGGQGPYTYQWNTGQTTSSITVSPTHTTEYTATATDALGQHADASVTVTVAPALSVAVSASPNQVVVGATSSVTAVASGGVPPHTYQWNTGQTTNAITVSPSQTADYTVTVTDSIGQQADGTATVTVAAHLSATASASPDLVAPGGSSTLTATPSGGMGPYTYRWNTGQTGRQIGVSPAQTTQYTVMVIDGLGQQATATTTVTVSAALSVTVAADPNAIALGDSSTLTASPSGGAAPYTHRWSTGQTSAHITVSPASTTAYSVTVTDALGQTATAQATVNVTVTYELIVHVSGPGTVQQTPASRTLFEAGETVTLKATPLEACDRFLGWEGIAAPAVAEITVTMNADKEATAIFYDGQLAPSSCSGSGTCQIALTGLVVVWFTRPGRHRPRPPRLRRIG